MDTTLNSASFVLGQLKRIISTLSLSLFCALVVSSALTSFAYATAQEHEILQLTNLERAKAKLKPLKLNPKLVKMAREQSALMAKADQLSHEVNGKHLAMRVKNAGYSYWFIAENVATSSEGISADALLKMWMSSNGHRKNILSRQADEIGIGIKVSQNGAVYYTQVFGKNREPKGKK